MLKINMNTASTKHVLEAPSAAIISADLERVSRRVKMIAWWIASGMASGVNKRPGFGGRMSLSYMSLQVGAIALMVGTREEELEDLVNSDGGDVGVV